MDKETKDIIKLIAGIQIEALTNIKADLEQGLVEQSLLKKLLNISDDEINQSLDTHLEIYKEMETFPTLIGTLSEYQLFVCSHILFRMEDEWVHTNSQGVLGAWSYIQYRTKVFHPELTLLKL